MVTDEQWSGIKAVMAAGYPREVVVAVLGDGSWREVANTHPEPTRHFRISLKEAATLHEQDVAVLLHTHPDGKAEPSDHDTDAQIATGWPWGICVVDGDAAGRVLRVHRPEIWGHGAPVDPLEGRSYLWGVRDCWTLVRDWYAQNGRELPPVPRVREPGAHHGDPARVNQFAHWPTRLGFQPVERRDRQPGDVAVMSWNKPYANHCAVYLGEARYLHQPEGALSSTWQCPHEERMLERMAVQFWRLPS